MEIDETFSFRDSVRKQTNADISPARPAAFLQAIFDAIRTNVQELSNSISDDNVAHSQAETGELFPGLLVIFFFDTVFLAYVILSLRAGLLPDFSILGIPSIIWFVGFIFVVGMAPYTFFQRTYSEQPQSPSGHWRQVRSF